jgi:hypothetical protein
LQNKQYIQINNASSRRYTRFFKYWSYHWACCFSSIDQCTIAMSGI